MNTFSQDDLKRKLRKMKKAHNKYILHRNKLCKDFKYKRIELEDCKSLITLNYAKFACDVEEIFFKETL